MLISGGQKICLIKVQIIWGKVLIDLEINFITFIQFNLQIAAKSKFSYMITFQLSLKCKILNLIVF